MGPFNNMYSRGPTMVLPNQHSQLNSTDTAMGASPFSYPGSEGISPSVYANHSTTWTPSSGRPSVATNPSKKRSRDDTHLESAAADGSYFPVQVVKTPAVVPEEPVYGEGMTLINSRTGVSVPAESQTGTWYEEKAEVSATNRIDPSTEIRPEMPSSRKTQRLHSSIPKPDDIAQAILPPSPTKMGASAEPTIDDFTLALGIGWTRIANEDSDVQAAARGWARYIDNHYFGQVNGVEILLKSRGLNAYLVGAREGFFLFSDDLAEGKLVGRTWHTTLTNLRTQPIVFEGTGSIKAARTPSPEPVIKVGLMGGHFGNAVQNSANGTWSVVEEGTRTSNNEAGSAGVASMEVD